MDLEKHFKLFGFRVRDVVTGFTGVVTSISFDLYGCVQAVVTPAAAVPENGKLEDSRWFDVSRLVATSEYPVMPWPTFELKPTSDSTVHMVPGPQEKPAGRV